MAILFVLFGLNVRPSAVIPVKFGVIGPYGSCPDEVFEFIKNKGMPIKNFGINRHKSGVLTLESNEGNEFQIFSFPGPDSFFPLMTMFIQKKVFNGGIILCVNPKMSGNAEDACKILDFIRLCNINISAVVINESNGKSNEINKMIDNITYSYEPVITIDYKKGIGFDTLMDRLGEITDSIEEFDPRVLSI